MSVVCFGTLLTNLEAANDDEVPQWAIVLKECFKSILTAFFFFFMHFFLRYETSQRG